MKRRGFFKKLLGGVAGFLGIGAVSSASVNELSVKKGPDWWEGSGWKRGFNDRGELDEYSLDDFTVKVTKQNGDVFFVKIDLKGNHKFTKKLNYQTMASYREGRLNRINAKYARN